MLIKFFKYLFGLFGFYRKSKKTVARILQDGYTQPITDVNSVLQDGIQKNPGHTNHNNKKRTRGRKLQVIITTYELIDWTTNRTIVYNSSRQIRHI